MSETSNPIRLERIEMNNGVRVLRVHGNLDIAGVGAIETKFYAHCDGEQPQVAVDLAAVNFIASLGIRLLIQAAKTVKARGGKLWLVNPTAGVAAALEIAGLSQWVQPPTGK